MLSKYIILLLKYLFIIIKLKIFLTFVIIYDFSLKIILNPNKILFLFYHSIK